MGRTALSEVTNVLTCSTSPIRLCAVLTRIYQNATQFSGMVGHGPSVLDAGHGFQGLDLLRG